MAKMKMRRWLTSLWGMFVQGGSNAALATLGIAGASTIGVDVTPLNYKQVGAVFLAGAVIKTLRFLEQAPAPDFDPTSTGDTEMVSKTDDQSKPKE